MSQRRHYHFALLGRRKQGRKPPQSSRHVRANSNPVTIRSLLLLWYSQHQRPGVSGQVR